MGATNLQPYTNEEILLATFNKALAHPARVKMMRLLQQQKSFRNCDMANVLNLSQSTIHRHIYALHQAGFVHLEYADKQYFVTLNKDIQTVYLDLLNN
jgi:DNA-binding transcriptional ArsR family regulator